MKDEYDFSGAEQGKFHRPIEELDIPIYLDKEVNSFFIERLKARDQDYSLNKVINALLLNQLSSQGITKV